MAVFNTILDSRSISLSSSETDSPKSDTNDRTPEIGDSHQERTLKSLLISLTQESSSLYFFNEAFLLNVSLIFCIMKIKHNHKKKKKFATVISRISSNPDVSKKYEQIKISNICQYRAISHRESAQISSEQPQGFLSKADRKSIYYLLTCFQDEKFVIESVSDHITLLLMQRVDYIEIYSTVANIIIAFLLVKLSKSIFNKRKGKLLELFF